MNEVVLTGRFTEKVNVYATKDDKSIANFCLAVQDREGYRDKKTGEFPVAFVRCCCFNSSLSECLEKYTDKGDSILVKGKLRTGNYTNNEGVKIYTTEVEVTYIEFLENKKKEDDDKVSGKKNK